MAESAAREQEALWAGAHFPSRVRHYPQLRYMGSKHRLLPWIHSVLSGLDFDTALDAFGGSNCVAYLMKSMGKEVLTNDFLNFSYQIALATIENTSHRLTADDFGLLLEENPDRGDFIERTFTHVFYTPEDLRFLDNIWANLPRLASRYQRALAIAALVRSCVKRQPRGVFTVAGDPEQYKDGRRDLRLALSDHFLESAEAYNATIFKNGHKSKAYRCNIFELGLNRPPDLVYMDPPYVPRSDDNCYIKRYHFLEGLSSYWQAEDAVIRDSSKVKKLVKRFTPFSYRKTATQAFEDLFGKFRDSNLVLSYSSNGFPDLDVLVGLMKKHKRHVDVFEQNHRYHFGTHKAVAPSRNLVQEYLIVGT